MSYSYSLGLKDEDRENLLALCEEYGFKSQAAAHRVAVKLLTAACLAEKDGGAVVVQYPGALPVIMRTTP